MDIKRKSNILIGLLVVSLLWGGTQYSQKISYKRHLDAQYKRMFYNLIDNVETIQSNLSKVNVSTSTRQNVIILSEIMNQSYSAQEKMTQLPLNHVALGKTEKFLTQIGDYTITLAKETIDDRNLTDKERKKLYELQRYSQYLSEELQTLRQDIIKGEVEFMDVATESSKKLRQTNKSMIATNMIKIEERMTEMPELIYDGPFSEHIGKIKPRISGEKIDKDKAKQLALEFLREKNISDLTYDGRLKNAPIPGYIFTTDNITLAISDVGGKVIWMVDSREIKEKVIKKEDALITAKDFLEKKGYKGMVPTYSLQYDDTITINFAYKQGDVVIYPDLVKVKIGMDNKEVVGFESQGYLVSHYDRPLEKPKVTIEEASKGIIKGSEIKKVRLAVIPTEGKRENLCYEFRVSYENRNFLIYVDAVTGKQQKILELIKNENGTLTM